MERLISRREFVKDYLFPYGSASLLLSLGFSEILDKYSQQAQERKYVDYKTKLDWLFHPDNYDIHLRYQSPGILKDRYLIPNSPYLATYTNEEQSYVFNKTPGSDGYRIYIDDRLEPKEFSCYDHSIIPQVRKLARRLAIDNKILIVEIIDGFSMSSSINLNHGIHIPTSIYAIRNPSNIYDIGTEENDALKFRTETLAKALNDMPNVVFSTGNELKPGKGRTDKEKYVRLHEDLVGIIKGINPQSIVIAGNRSPSDFCRSVKGLDGISAHIYMQFDGVTPWNFKDQIMQSKMQTMPLEFGFSNSINLKEYDSLNKIIADDEVTAWMLLTILKEGSQIIQQPTKRYTAEILFVPTIGPWKAGIPSYQDGFDFDIKKYPLTYFVIAKFAQAINYPSKIDLDYVARELKNRQKILLRQQ